MREGDQLCPNLRKVNATAILLMPICESAGDHGWEYNPSFFYAVESAYGGPDALKALVDAAHERGLAVLLDVVFNHAGASDNALWSVANESFFDGDTEWGAMINVDHPQVVHFFEQNLVHFMTHDRVAGFRFDFTRVIRLGHEWTAHVKRPGSGGGWGFTVVIESRSSPYLSRQIKNVTAGRSIGEGQALPTLTTAPMLTVIDNNESTTIGGPALPE